MSSLGRIITPRPSNNSISNASSSSHNNRSFLPSTPPGPSSSNTIEQSSILNSIQRRVLQRSSDDDWNEPEDLTLFIQDLEKDLEISARLGIALVEEKQKLEKQKSSVEAANNVLLDRITLSVKENAQLQRRLEQAVGNLEQSDANNRALLVSLEEDRKTISRLSVDSARLVSASSQLKTTTQAFEDLKQELVSEKKRASQAEYRMKKHGERVLDMEESLRKAISDLEAMRQDKVLRNKNSRDALAIVKARFSRGIEGFGQIGENSEAAELLKVVESLVSENDLLKSESLELHGLLDVSRDEQLGLRLEIAEHQPVVELEEEDFTDPPLRRQSFRHTRTNTPLNLRAELLSPSISQSSELDYGRQFSPTSTNPTSYAPHSPTSRSTKTDFSTSFSTNSLETGDQFSQQSLEEVKVLRRRSGVPSPGLATNGGTVPFGRGHGRRAVSVDVASFGVIRNNSTSSQTSPYHPSNPSPPPTRPVSLVSNSDAEDVSIGRKHRPRPLSLSLGPSLFPIPIKEDRSYSPKSYPEGIPPLKSSIPISTSTSPSASTSRTGLSGSPTKRPRHSSPTTPARIAISIDCSTQTSPISILPTSPLPRLRSERTDPFTDLQSTTSASDVSERDKDFPLTMGATESRTAALGALIDYTAKLLGRIQNADIVSQENRLRKQNLPGDVRHLAQANLRDLLVDIEGLRAHFRRLLEQERAASARENNLNPTDSLSESLVNRKDFVALVKLFRDLLFETSRLRSLVNRIELEPNLAVSLRDLDILNVIDMEQKSQNSTGGLLAPLSRLFVGTLLGETQKPPIRQLARAPTKLSGSSAVTSATVNVEFGKGQSKRAVTVGTSQVASPSLTKSTSSQDSTSGKTTISSKSGTQVKRDLNNLFVGTAKTSAEPWVVLPSRNVPTSNPFGRLLSSYRPALTSTTYAVLDSLPHQQPPDQGHQPNLLERQLRPRGLSDSSIRSTFISHANPHHRIVSPATLALSSEVTINVPTEVQPILSKAPDRPVGELKRELNSLSTSVISISRKQSMNRLRSKPSSMQIRSTSTSSSKSIEPVPPLPNSNTSTSPLPISISISPSPSDIPSSKLKSHTDHLESGVQSNVGSLATAGGGGGGSFFGQLSSWATSSSSQMRPSHLAGKEDDERRRLGVSSDRRGTGSRSERGREPS